MCARIGDMLFALDDFERALQLFERALQLLHQFERALQLFVDGSRISQETPWYSTPKTACLLTRVGKAKAHLRDHVGMTIAYQRAQQIFQETGSCETVEYAFLLMQMGN